MNSLKGELQGTLEDCYPCYQEFVLSDVKANVVPVQVHHDWNSILVFL